MNVLQMTFPRDEPCIALGCAEGVMLRYEVRHVSRGAWELTIDADKQRRTRSFRNKREAQSFARRDFARRQMLRLAA